MNIKKILPLVLLGLLSIGGGWMGLSSCVNDSTTLPTRPLSEITIVSGIDSIYNINKNEALRIKPALQQSNTPKELTYTWEVDQQVYSHDEEFNYPARQLGTFLCRLIVENEDGKTYTIDDVLVHDAHCEDNTLQLKLALMGNGDGFPVALGVIRDVDAPTYDDAVSAQIEEVKAAKKYHNFTELLETNDIWEVK